MVRICWIASVKAIWLVLLLGEFGLFCAVRGVSFDGDILSGFGCFWFGTLTGRKYQETASCPMLQVVPSNWFFVVVVVMSSRVSEISDTLCLLQCVGLRGHHKRVDPEECVMVFQTMLAHDINTLRYVSISSVCVVPCKRV